MDYQTKLFLAVIVLVILGGLIACGITAYTYGGPPPHCVRGAPCHGDQECELVGRCKDGHCFCGPYQVVLPYVIRNAIR